MDGTNSIVCVPFYHGLPRHTPIYVISAYRKSSGRDRERAREDGAKQMRDGEISEAISSDHLESRGMKINTRKIKWMDKHSHPLLLMR